MLVLVLACVVINRALPRDPADFFPKYAFKLPRATHVFSKAKRLG